MRGRLAASLDDLAWLVLAALLNMAAPRRMRERAYCLGFARALGDPGSHWWTGKLHEYTAGNEAGLDAREAAGGRRGPLCLIAGAPRSTATAEEAVRPDLRVVR
jgi:hypothetical protein